MKKILSIMFLVILALGVQASAETFSQQLMTLYRTVHDKINNSKLNPSIKNDFIQQLSTILTDAGCKPTGAETRSASADPCAGATPSAIQQAEGKLKKVSDAVDAAITED